MNELFRCEGVALHTSLQDGRGSGTLLVESEALIFSSSDGPSDAAVSPSANGHAHATGSAGSAPGDADADAPPPVTVRIPLAGLRIERGGANNKLIFLSHPSVDGWTFYTRQWGVLDALIATREQTVCEQIFRLRRGHRSDHSSAWLILGLLVFAIVALWSIRDPIARWVSGWIPVSWEQKAGDTIFGAARGELHLIDREELSKPLRELAMPIIEQAEKKGFRIQIFVSRSDELNAFALPGGYVVVTTELIRRAERPEEILAVLAHEISHVTERHSVRQLVSVIGIYWVADLVLGNFVGSIAALSQAGPLLLQQSFSRDHEREADEQGLKYLVSANVDPNGMVEFFRRVLEEQMKVPVGEVMEKHLNFLSTHPATTERIETLTREIQALPPTQYPPQSRVPFEKLKAAVAATKESDVADDDDDAAETAASENEKVPEDEKSSADAGTPEPGR